MEKKIIFLRKAIFKCIYLSLILFCILLIQCKDPDDDSNTNKLPTITLPAFPGAEGFGSKTAGGRGGKIIEVTNLNPSGPGSFPTACAATYPRIIVFRTNTALVDKRNDYLSITLNKRAELQSVLSPEQYSRYLSVFENDRKKTP